MASKVQRNTDVADQLRREWLQSGEDESAFAVDKHKLPFPEMFETTVTTHKGHNACFIQGDVMDNLKELLKKHTNTNYFELVFASPHFGLSKCKCILLLPCIDIVLFVVCVCVSLFAYHCSRRG